MRILIDNALTHTPPGTQIVVTAARENGHVRLAVRDDGEGIDRLAQQRIFEPFYTADDAQGSGLGLAIASELAERMRAGCRCARPRGRRRSRSRSRPERVPPEPGVTRSPRGRAGAATPRCASGTAAWRGSGGRSGTSPTIAIVAACSDSATSGPVNVAPTITSRCLVDDDPARRRRALADEARPRRAAELGVDGAGRDAGVERLASVWPTAATCGSVKTTRGDSAPSQSRAGLAVHDRWPPRPRAWYLPAWVSSARPLTSPIAYSQSRGGPARASGRRRRSSRPARGRRSRGRGRRCGARARRPRAARRS